MRAVFIEGPGQILIDDVPPPPDMPGECRVAVRLAGICKTDTELLKGYMDFRGVPGHEFVGTVVDGDDGLIGRRVVGDINASCGVCAQCAAGMGRHCSERTVLGIYRRSGAFAEFLSLPRKN